MKKADQNEEKFSLVGYSGRHRPFQNKEVYLYSRQNRGHLQHPPAARAFFPINFPTIKVSAKL